MEGKTAWIYIPIAGVVGFAGWRLARRLVELTSDLEFIARDIEVIHPCENE